MNGGGIVIIPNEPYKSHDEALQPVRAIAAWAYTDLSDPRWTLGSKYIRLRTDPALKASQKIGVANRVGWAGYLRTGTLFIKRVDWDDDRRVPGLRREHRDLHLGELHRARDDGAAPQRIAPGGAATHEERWSLFKGVDAGTTEASLDAALQPLVAQAK